MKTDEDDALLKAFGKRLAAVRREKDWSQEKLALESGLARSYIGDVERGVRNPSLINLGRIAVTLEIELSQLMSFKKPKVKKK